MLGVDRMSGSQYDLVAFDPRYVPSAFRLGIRHVRKLTWMKGALAHP